MLSGLYRPALAMVPGAAGTRHPAAEARAQGQLAGAPQRLEPAKPLVPVERVRSSIVPVALRVDDDSADDPWRLFDGDGALAFSFKGKVRVRATLPESTTIESIGVYGPAEATLTVYAGSSSGPKPVPGMESVALAGKPLRWNRVDLERPTETSELTFEFSAPPGQSTGVRELEIWGKAPLSIPRDLQSSAAATELLLTGVPPGAVNIAATPAEAAVSAPLVGQSGAVNFQFALDRARRTFERAFLVYDLEDLPHWSAVPRRINGQSAQGGFGAAHAARGGRQVEEISPDWLRAGQNQIAFLVANHDDPKGYKVKNVRVVAIPAAANQAAFAPAAGNVRAPAALLDGNRETAVAAQDVGRGGQIFDLAFERPTQPDSLLLAVEKGAKGKISARPIARGKLAGREVVATLENLAPGWNRVRLDDTPTDVEGVRISLSAGAESAAGALISELRVTGSRRPNRPGSRLAISYPLHGECVDGEAYLRGFLRTDGAGTTKGAVLRIDGSARPADLAADGSFSTIVTPPSAAARRGGKWQVVMEADFANGDATGGVVDIEGCREPEVVTHNGPREDEGAPFGQWVRAGQPATLSFAGAKLEIPAGAVDKDTRITVRPIEGIEVPATDENLTNVTPGARAYRLGPHGLKFGKPVALTIPYDRSRFVGGQAEDDMGVFFFDEDAKRWRQVQTIHGDAGARTLVAATEHFTDFITGTISSPDHPAADSFNPNSIKDMKSAGPAAGIDLIAPPAPSPDGAAHLSFPIWVPSGRQGLQPGLAATYSSEVGNGFLGVGWDLPISSIQVDTRFGVPKYLTDQESETYTLDGELLVIDPAQNGGRTGRVVFHRRAEGKFDTIIRTGPGPLESDAFANGNDVGGAYRWEVIDKHGTHFIYGETFNSRASVLGRGVFRWYLNRVVDPFGNQITYQYSKQAPPLHGVADQSASAVEVYPQSIFYTSNPAVGQNAFYRIDFELDGGGGISQLPADTAPRPDQFSSARGGTLTFMRHRLVNIRVYEASKSGTDYIRRYNFVYGTGAFGKSLLTAIRVCIGEDVLNPDQPGNPVEFYRHTFSYVTLPNFPLRNVPGFGQPRVWGDVGSADGGFSNTQSDSLNGTSFAGWGPGGCAAFHGVVGGSFSPDSPVPLPSFIPHTNEDTTARGFVDVNGDGLPDFVTGGSTFLNNASTIFTANPGPLFVLASGFQPPPGSVGHASHSMVSLQAGAHFLAETSRLGLERDWSSNNTDTLLTDINGDGFVDWVSTGGAGVATSLNLGQGFPAPTASSTWGFPGGGIVSLLPPDIAAQQKATFQLTDPTSRWDAPYSGQVLITGAVRKVQQGPASQDDGVTVFIQSFTTASDGHGTFARQTSNWSHDVTDTTPCTPANQPTPNGCGGGLTIPVSAGDRIYFRASSKDLTDFDTLSWAPLISYQTICDQNGNCPAVTSDQKSLSEPFGTAAFDFNQAADFRLAGKPIPRWKSDSFGPATVQISGGIIKRSTSDAVTVQVLQVSASNGAQQVIFPKPTDALQNPLPAGQDSATPIPVNLQATVNLGDKLIFQISSPTPIDPQRVSWTPTVEYQTFCRQDYTTNTPFCGTVDLSTCTSDAAGGQCFLVGDPAQADNPISANAILQNVAPYYQLSPSTPFGAPAGFVAKSDGQITFQGQLQGAAARVVVRAQNQLLFDGNAVASLGQAFPPSPVTIPVHAGDSVMFDVFATETGFLGAGASDPGSWSVNVQFNGTSGSEAHTIAARRNVQLASADPGSGNFHGWSVLEWNDAHTFDDGTIGQALAQGLDPNTVKQTGDTPLHLMTEVFPPQGLSVQGALVSGPLWHGAGFDSYIAAGAVKPSRLAKPISGAAPTLVATSSTTDDDGAEIIFGAHTASSSSATQVQLIDMNGDRYPDLVTNSSIRYNDAVNKQFDANPTPIAIGDLRDTNTHQVSGSVGISAAAHLAAGDNGLNGPMPESHKWMSALPSLGISYGLSTTSTELMDINGDGLPDRVTRDASGLSASINLGYSFTVPIPYGSPTWELTGSDASTFIDIGGVDLQGFSPNFTSTVQGLVADQTLGHPIRLDALRLEDSASNHFGAGYAWFGGNSTAGVSRTFTDMIDINGDGLPDMLMRRAGSDTMSVKINTGDGFLPEVQWVVQPWSEVTGTTPTTPMPALEKTRTVGFGTNDALAFSDSDGFGFSVGYPSYTETGITGCWVVEGGFGASRSHGKSEMRFEDIDGDGAPDQVLKLDGDSRLFVRLNPMSGIHGAVDLLQIVTTPIGGTITLRYDRLGHVVDPTNHVDMPQHQLALTAVVLSDPFTLQTETDIDYSLSPTPFGSPTPGPTEPSGFYSRAEREFFGYSHVAATQIDGNRVQRTYDTSSYARKHLLLTETVLDQSVAERAFRRTSNHYDDRPVGNPAVPNASFPALTSQVTSFYEGLTDDLNAPVKITTLTYDYDAFGNVKSFADAGDVGASDDVSYTVGYQQITDPATGAPFFRANLVTAFDAAGNVLRKRQAGYGNQGQMQDMFEALIGGKDPASGALYGPGTSTIPSVFGYDSFGNLTSTVDPTGYALTYTYDPDAQTHVATITDSFGYASSRRYDMHFGALSDTTDINGQKEHVDYDPYGRMIRVYGPLDTPGTFPATVAFDYAIATTLQDVPTKPAWARTQHKDAQHPSDTLDTVVFVDGHDRVIQTKKDASVGGTAGRIVSGRVLFDLEGRVIMEGFPTFEVSTTTETQLNDFPIGRPAKRYTYDVLSRVRSIQTPDDNGPDIPLFVDNRPVVTTLIDFNVKTLDGVARLTKTTQDPQGKLRTQYLSPRGEVLAVSEVNRVGTAFPNGTPTVLTTRYTYDPLSQLTQVQDANGNLTTASYDSRGLMVKLVSLDAGQTEWRYDVAGKLGAKETANLRAQGKVITYGYDINRLKTITYPTSLPVTYSYGAPSEAGPANANRAGRIKQVTDESGVETRKYDSLGNVSHMEKTPATQSPSIPGVTYKMDYAYDSLGRALTMTYPDGELVTYTYDAGGLVNSVAGTRKGTTTNYVTGIQYNELEQRTQIAFGNNVSTGYSYYPDTKRLFSAVTTSGSAMFQRLLYAYDLVGNITNLQNNLPFPAPVPPNTVIAPGPAVQVFTYDDLYQLTSAAGSYQGCACGCQNQRSFTLTMGYDAVGNITHKTQNDVIEAPTGSGQFTTQLSTTYNNTYGYTSPRPHAPTAIGTETLGYDADGNLTSTNGTFGPSRILTWNEEDRLRTETDSGFTSAYLYDAAGNRSHKRRTTLETWYVNPLFQVKNSLTETKHIMVGESRIASVLATISNRADPTTAGAGTYFYYHPDHLQSTQFTTGADGSILQHDEYFPSGEVWFQEAKNNDARNTQPWLFSAKELDETGFYYFGARYYNPKYGVWASADPILGSYLQRGAGGASPKNLELYSYAWNNPVVMRDPDGRAVSGTNDATMRQSVQQAQAQQAAAAQAVAARQAQYAAWFNSLPPDHQALVRLENAGGAAAARDAALERTAQGARRVSPIIQVYAVLTNLMVGLATGGVFAEGAGLLAPRVTAPSIVRRAVAQQFYEAAGWSPARIADHLTGIDFNQSVDIVNIPAGTPVVQYQIPGAPVGNYFAPVGTSGNTLGIYTSGRVADTFTAIQDTTVLRSTAADVNITWEVKGWSIEAQGGGTQFFEPNPAAFR
jgi:RHS repeat-associated protein